MVSRSKVDSFIIQYKSGDKKPLKKYLFDKKSRGKDLIVQYDNLIYVFKNQDIELSMRLNALSAAAHKAMESMEFDLVLSVGSLIKENLYLVSQLDINNDIRLDKTHIYYSLNTSLLFSYIFLGEFSKAYELSVLIDSKINNDIEKNCFTTGFYQTCTNIIRCIVFKGYLEVVNNEIESSGRSFETIMKLLSLGISFHDLKVVKYSEWFYAAETVNIYSKIYDAALKTDRSSLYKIISEHIIEKRIIRPHCEAKYKYMTNKLAKYIDDSYVF